MVDFRKLMTPEQRDRFDRDQAYIEKERDRHRSMTNADLAKHAQHYIDNSEGPRKYPAEVPVYDNAVWHFVLPELMRRVASIDSAGDASLDALETLLAQMGHGKHGKYLPGGGTDDCRVWTGYVDEHGYPDPRRSIDVADCSMARSSGDTTWLEPLRRFHALAVGRAIAALLNAAPELLRLARIGKDAEKKPSVSDVPVL